MEVQTTTTLDTKQLNDALGYLGIGAARKSSSFTHSSIPVTEALKVWGDGTLNLHRGGLRITMRGVLSDMEVRLVDDIAKQVKTMPKNSTVTLADTHRIESERVVRDDAGPRPTYHNNYAEYGNYAEFKKVEAEWEENAYEDRDVYHPELALSSGKRTFNLKAYSPEDYPNYPDASDATVVAIYDAQELLLGLDRTAPYMSTDDTRPVLTGTCFEFATDSTKLVCTDSYRLIMHDLPGLADDTVLEQDVIVAGGDLALLRKLLKKSVGSVEFASYPESCGAVFTGVTESFDYELSVCLVDGNFPEYRRLLPLRENMLYAEADRAQLEEAIKAALVMASTTTPPPAVHLQFTEDGLNVSLQDESSGSFQEDVEALSDPEASAIALNPKYALEALSAFTGETVEIGVQPYSSAGFSGGEGFRDGTFSNKPMMFGGEVLLMPMRVDK